jgi:methanogenic corrinoid protein MtbC1
MHKKLITAIRDIQEEEALTIANNLINSGADPMKIMDSCSTAMDMVGKLFEEGEYFLPELMMAGEILKQISNIVKPKIAGTVASQRKGKVLIGTVEGDIHDIGKDIVAFLLDVNEFEVRDIGIDASPEKFVQMINDFKPAVVGMSGLLTVAYESMKNTVRAIEEAGLRNKVKIMIGGGQMSDNICTYAGADAYGKDAIAGVNLVKNWLEVNK